MFKTYKSVLWVIFPIALMVLFIIFLFSLPSTYGIFKWNEYYKNLLIKISLIPIFISIFGILSILFKNKKNLNKAFYLIAKILNLLFLVIILGAIFFIIYNSTPNFDKISPIMILLPSTGSYGLPDIAITLKSFKKEEIHLSYTISKDEIDPSTLNFDKTLKNEENSNYHKFIIKDLIPDSFYYFKLSDNKFFKYKTPKTKISDSTAFVFSACSDSHFGREESRDDISEKIAELVQKDNENSFFAILGDFVESGYSKSHWIKLNEFISSKINSIPILPVMGNHDAFIGGHRFFKAIFSMVKDENSHSSFYHHYTFNLTDKKIHIISLSLLWGVEDFSLKQKLWLQNELSKVENSDFVIILTHAFIYASGYTEEGGIPWFDNLSAIKTLHPIFKNHDVDLVISGHNHTMELIENDSIYYSIIGSFGGLPDPNRTYTSKGSLWYQSGKFGYLKIKSFLNNFILSFYDENNRLIFEKECDY